MERYDSAERHQQANRRFKMMLIHSVHRGVHTLPAVG